MFGSAVLEIGLGLALLYFLVATITSHLNEVIAAVLQRRGAFLEQGIKNLIGNEKLASDVLGNPVVTGLASATGGKPAYLAARHFSVALLQEVRKDPELMPPTVGALMETFGASADGVRHGIEQWYDAAMSRLSGAYKRRTQLWLFGIALVLVAGANLDSIAIGNAIWQAQNVRALSSAASSVSSDSSLTAAVQTLVSSGLPFGWSKPPADAGQWALKVVGLLTTTLAVALGAQFWFSVLTSFMNPRSSGPRPAPSSTG